MRYDLKSVTSVSWAIGVSLRRSIDSQSAYSSRSIDRATCTSIAATQISSAVEPNMRITKRKNVASTVAGKAAAMDIERKRNILLFQRMDHFLHVISFAVPKLCATLLIYIPKKIGYYVTLAPFEPAEHERTNEIQCRSHFLRQYLSLRIRSPLLFPLQLVTRQCIGCRSTFEYPDTGHRSILAGVRHPFYYGNNVSTISALPSLRLPLSYVLKKIK